MPDDRIYDAINIFKFSPTGRGTANIGGDAMYQERYRRLAADILARLWGLWNSDEIGFAKLRTDLIGDSQTRRAGPDIRVNILLEPSSDTTTYQDATNQSRLAAASCNIVHEATHLVRHIACYPEEETLCRTIQVFYFRDLRSPQNYHSRFANVRCTARFLTSTPFYHGYESRLNRILSGDLIDSVLNIAEYRRDLETEATAEFIKRSLNWWGGLSNRWPSTRGYYLRSLAACRGHDFAEQILTILESLTTQQWLAAKTVAGSLERIREGLARGHHLYDTSFAGRISRVQERLGENLGIVSS